MREFLAAFCLTIVCLPAHAGGPILSGSNAPLRWGSNPVRYNLDRGPLGDLSNSEAGNMVFEAFNAWSDNDLAALRFLRGSNLARDFSGADITSLSRLFSLLQSELSGTNPIFLDSDGSIVDNIFGNGSSRDVLGFASSLHSGSEIMQAYAVLNGLFLTAPPSGFGFSSDEYLSTAVHEFGHFSGIDHTMVGRYMANDGYGPNDRYVPVMYPTTTDDESMRPAPVMDDRVAFALSYPNPSGLLNSDFGWIQGIATQDRAGFSNPIALRGAHVVARKVDDPLRTVVSGVSDYLRAGDGAFELRGLPKGEYEVWIEPIDTRFVGASSVGPYANSAGGRSFTEAPMPEYFNGSDEAGSPASDPRSRVESITVRKGRATNADLITRALDVNGVGSDERRSQILAYGSPLRSAAPGRTPGGGVLIRSIVFCVVVDDNVDLLRIAVDAENEVDLGLFVAFDRFVRVDDFDNQIRTQSADEVLELQRGGSLDLRTGTYFIEVINETTTPETFTLSVFTEDDLDSTPTPTGTPTPTPTTTETPTPTHTPTVPAGIRGWRLH